MAKKHERVRSCRSGDLKAPATWVSPVFRRLRPSVFAAIFIAAIAKGSVAAVPK